MRLRRTVSHGAPRGQRPLIGVDDVVTPPWATVDEQIVRAKLGTTLRAAPAAAAVLVRLAWSTSPRLVLIAAGLQLAAGFATAFGLLATASVLTELLEQGPTPERVVAAIPALVLLVVIYAARGLLESAVSAAEAVLLPRVERRAQDELHTAVIGVDLVAFDDADFVELVRRASGQGIAGMRGVTDVGDLLGSAVALVAALVAVAVLDPLLLPVVVVAALPNGWASLRSARLSYESFLAMVSRSRRLGVTSGLITSRRDAAEIRAFTTERALLDEHRRIAAELSEEAVEVAHRRTVIQLFGRGLSGVGSALAYVVLGLLLYAGSMPLALAGAAAVAMRTANSAVSRSLFSANRLYEHHFYLQLYRRCVFEAGRRRRQTDWFSPAELTGDPDMIRLHAVSFSYPGQKGWALSEISLTIRRGEVVALVGENGSGKTTLAKIITGLYVPDEGRVRWDGVDISRVEPAQLYSRLAVVVQDPTEWPMTAENNIRIGRIEGRDPGNHRLAAAAAQSGAEAVIAELPEGWDTVLSRQFQNGRDLSGGQWQRFSLARAFYRDAAVLVADEPTASLDAKAEQIVFNRLRELSQRVGDESRTTVLITHRLANVRHADRIFVLDAGRLVEQGTHEELLAAGGAYAELFRLQAEAYTSYR